MTLEGDDNFDVRFPLCVRLVVVPGTTQVSLYGEYIYYWVSETADIFKVTSMVGSGVDISARFIYDRVGIAQTSIMDPAREAHSLNGFALSVGFRAHNIIKTLTQSGDDD